MKPTWVGATAVELLNSRQPWSVQSLFASSANLRLSADPGQADAPLIHVGFSGIQAPYGVEIQREQWLAWRRAAEHAQAAGAASRPGGMWDPRTGSFGGRATLALSPNWRRALGPSSVIPDSPHTDLPHTLPSPSAAFLMSGLAQDPASAQAMANVRKTAKDLLSGALGHGTWLIGHGPGVTPSGDDVLIGMLGVFHRLGMPGGTQAAAGQLADAVRDGRSTTAVSRAYLLDAAKGRFAWPLRNLLLAPGTIQFTQALTALRTLGHTSGRDTVLGMAAAYEALEANRNLDATHRHDVQGDEND